MIYKDLESWYKIIILNKCFMFLLFKIFLHGIGMAAWNYGHHSSQRGRHSIMLFKSIFWHQFISKLFLHIHGNFPGFLCVHNLVLTFISYLSCYLINLLSRINYYGNLTNVVCDLADFTIYYFTSYYCRGRKKEKKRLLHFLQISWFYYCLPLS